MKTISLKVSDSLASKLESLPPEKMEELEQLISEWLEPRKRLLKSLRAMQGYAKKQGLNDEKFEELFDDQK